jgi:hypothetical protein
MWHSFVLQKIRNTSDVISTLDLQHVQYKCMSFGIEATNFFPICTHIKTWAYREQNTMVGKTGHK